MRIPNFLTFFKEKHLVMSKTLHIFASDLENNSINLKLKEMINSISNAAMTAQTETTEKRSMSNEQVINNAQNTERLQSKIEMWSRVVFFLAAEVHESTDDILDGTVDDIFYTDLHKVEYLNNLKDLDAEINNLICDPDITEEDYKDLPLFLIKDEEGGRYEDWAENAIELQTYPNEEMYEEMVNDMKISFNILIN